MWRYLRAPVQLSANSSSLTEEQSAEKDCQYIDENELPCPLSLALFTDEINLRMIAE